MNILKKSVVLIMILFYFFAGVNHFIKPETYINIIPPYLPWPETLNNLAGIFEILFALLLIPVKTRKISSWGIILMLIAFMPVHIYMIQQASLDPLSLGQFTITPLIAWVRIPFQIIFIVWAYWCGTMKLKFIKNL